MPAYNEGEHIAACVREWHELVTSRIPSSELIVVDDRSTDDTWAVLQSLKVEIPELRPLRPERNGGHGRAVRFGLLQATGEFVFQTDSDRQHRPEDFWKLWRKREGVDFVFGIREARADGLVRIVVTRVMQLLNFIIWQVWIQDANCPFKLMRRSALQTLLRKIPEDLFIPMVMISILARHHRYAIAEEFVRHLSRTAGEQSLKGLTTWVKVGSRCSAQLLRLRFRPSSVSSHLGASTTKAPKSAANS
jgi:glycosyltransferase involved in cell wall biosynthesis